MYSINILVTKHWIDISTDIQEKTIFALTFVTEVSEIDTGDQLT